MKMTKKQIIKDDGRYLIYYEFEDDKELTVEKNQDHNDESKGGN
jgi:hypothetical protein